MKLRAAGLDVNRADVVRLLLKHALDATRCNPTLLFPDLARNRRKRLSER
jgi:hypothetical protein